MRIALQIDLPGHFTKDLGSWGWPSLLLLGHTIIIIRHGRPICVILLSDLHRPKRMRNKYNNQQRGRLPPTDVTIISSETIDWGTTNQEWSRKRWSSGRPNAIDPLFVWPKRFGTLSGSQTNLCYLIGHWPSSEKLPGIPKRKRKRRARTKERTLKVMKMMVLSKYFYIAHRLRHQKIGPVVRWPSVSI